MQHCIVVTTATVCSVLLEYGLLVVYMAGEAEGSFFSADCSVGGEFLYSTCQHWRILALEGEELQGITRLFLVEIA